MAALAPVGPAAGQSGSVRRSVELGRPARERQAGRRGGGSRRPARGGRPTGAGEAAQIVRGGRSNRAWEYRSELNIQ